MQPPAKPADFLVEIDALRKQFGTVVAVRDLTLRIPAGGVFGLLGPNGSGKTTTIGLLLGLIKPTSGTMRLFGQDTRAAHLPALRRIGAMVESPVFYPDLSGRANLRFFQGIGRSSGKRARDAGELEHLLELVGLTERADSKFRTYSLGMKQRLGIAYALLGDPELVFLDEPTNGLDPSGMAEVRELIGRLAKTGRTVVLSSHMLNEVELVCDNVAILARGELLAQGKVRDLLQVQGSVRLKTTDNVRAEQILRGLDWVSSLRAEDGYLVAGMSADAPGELTRALCQHEVFVTEMVPLRVSLESYFLQVTGHDAGKAEAQ
jgi:ABC-2 type transport system ATP-binding protein